MNALEIMKNNHEKLQAIMASICETHDPALFELFKKEFGQYSLMEQLFHAALPYLPELEAWARKGDEATLMIKSILSKVYMSSRKSNRWVAKFAVIRDWLMLHIKDEEEILFPKVLTLVSEHTLNQIGNDLLRLSHDLSPIDSQPCLQQ
jgi:hypothetical protein